MTDADDDWFEIWLAQYEEDFELACLEDDDSE